MKLLIAFLTLVPFLSLQAEEECFYPPPTARVRDKGSGPFINLSFLFWQSRVESFYIINEVVNQTQTYKGMDFAWAPGFKLGIGQDIHRDSWDIQLNWTYIRSHACDSYTANPPNFLIPQQSSIASVTRADSTWHLLFNTIDLELGREFYVGKRLDVRPFAGFKAGWLRHNFLIDYDAESLTLYQRHRALGPRFGIQSRWLLNHYEVAFVANGALSVLWNRTRQLNEIEGITIHYHEQFINPIYEVFVGIDWRGCFTPCVLFELSGGYEIQLWQNELRNVVIPSNNTNLFLHGLTLNFSLFF